MITLYIKTHLDTGLKYFGKTKNEAKKYKGSGTYWKDHIRKHGNHVNTEIYFQSDDIILLNLKALEFSRVNDIVNSKEWANLVEETGLDGTGGRKGKKNSPEHRTKISESNKGRKHSNEVNKSKGRSNEENHMYGKHHSEETKKKISENRPNFIGETNPMYGKSHSKESKDKISEKSKESYKNGRLNPASICVHIFNEKDELMFECIGNFNKVCKDNNLPNQTLRKSYLNDSSKIFVTKKNSKFHNWYAKKVLLPL